jgi:putative transposase
MKRSRFSEEQVIGIVKEQEAGMPTVAVCRRHGVSPATFYRWKLKFGGLEVSGAKRLRSLEDENAKPKKLLAEAMLDIAVLKDITGKNGNARCQAGCSDACPDGVRAERAQETNGGRVHWLVSAAVWRAIVRHGLMMRLCVPTPPGLTDHIWEKSNAANVM